MKKIKSLLAIVLSILMVAASAVILPVSAAAADIWDGTVDTTWYNGSDVEFTLTTAAQLAGLATLVNDGNNFSGKTVKLGADMKLNSNADINNFANWDSSAPALSWTPISYYLSSGKNSFNGTFDGDGHTISGMYINDADGSNFGGRPALFGYLNGATIKNVTVEKSYVAGKNCTGIIAAFHSGTAPTFDNIGINACKVVGASDGSSFIMGKMGGFGDLNITNIAVVESTIDCSYGGGALLGYLSGSNMGNINIDKCNVQVTINATYGDDRGSGGLIGILGQINNPAPSKLTSLNITDTYVATTAVGQRDIGGVIGTVILDTLGTFKYDGGGVWVDIDCSASTKNISDIGGVISYLRVFNVTETVSFKNMYVHGSIQCGQNTAGLIGRIQSYPKDKFVAINNIDVSDVDMELAIFFKKGTGSAQCIGGVIGLAQNPINTVTISGLQANNIFEGVNEVAIAENTNIGGIFGSTDAVAALEITDSTINEEFTNCGKKIGGIMGAAYAENLTITGSDISVKIEGTDNVGGLIGKSYKVKTITVSDTTIKAKLSAGEGKYAGAIAGQFQDTVPAVSFTNVDVVSTSTGNSLVGLTTEGVLTVENCTLDTNAEELGITIEGEIVNAGADYDYEVVDEETIIKGYKGEGGDVVIPEILGGYPVTSIVYGAFHDCTSLTSVVIPEGVTSIEDSTFIGCTNLVSASIPFSVTSIGNVAFSGCESLESVNIPYGVTDIGESAFAGCTSLEVISLPYSVTSLGEYAFSGCIGLGSIDIPGSISEISRGAFNGCTGIESAYFTDTLTTVGESAFSGCSNLVTVYYTGDAEAWQNVQIENDNDPLLSANKVYGFENILAGDVDGDGVVTSDDAIYLLYFTLLPDMYPIEKMDCDFDSDGAVTSDDAIYLLYYTLLPDMYPLYPAQIR